MIWFVRLQKNDEGNGNPTDEQEPSLTRRVMDVMMMKKTNLEKNVEHYKAEGVKLTGKNRKTIYSVQWLNFRIYTQSGGNIEFTNCSSMLDLWLKMVNGPFAARVTWPQFS